MKRIDWKRIGLLFLKYFKMGAFTFGGGFSIVAQMQNEFVERQGWLTEEELLDFVSVGKSMPGIMVINVAVISDYNGYSTTWPPCWTAIT